MNPNNYNILIVDDDGISRRILETNLSKKGFKVSVAENGMSALESINKKAPDLVLLDIVMPQMNGFEVLAQLKASADLMHIPVIVISASDGVEDVVKCIEMGAEDHIKKPFEPAILQARIMASLNKNMVREQRVELSKAKISRAIESGRAQQAAMILHNLSNAMTPASDALQTLDQLCNPTFPNLLARCYSEFAEHDALRDLLGYDEKAAELFSYMGDLINTLDERTVEIKDSHSRIEASIGSMSKILALQQNYFTNPDGRLEDINLNHLIQDSLLMHQPLLEKHRVAVITKISDSISLIKTNKGRLMQALANLIRNSCEAFEADFFQGHRRKLIIETGMDQGGVFIKIEDNGPGIPQEFLPKVFNFDYSTKGTSGYGLYYCKQFMDSIGGTILIDSRNKQTRVTLYPEARTFSEARNYAIAQTA